MYHWAHQNASFTTLHHEMAFSSHTTVDWKNFCLEIFVRSTSSPTLSPSAGQVSSSKSTRVCFSGASTMSAGRSPNSGCLGGWRWAPRPGKDSWWPYLVATRPHCSPSSSSTCCPAPQSFRTVGARTTRFHSWDTSI